MRRAAIALAHLLIAAAACAQPQPADAPPDPPADSKPAATEEDQQAKDAYSAGVEHFKAKRYADAIREFNKAYRVDPNPVLVFNMARAFEELEEYDSAIEYYRRYLEMAPESEDSASVADTLRALELLKKRSAEAATVTLSVTSTPDGAQIYVNGREVGASPMKLELKPGRHFVAVEAKGFTRDSTEVELVAGKPDKHHATLVPIAPAPSAHAGSEHTTLGWVLIGVGGALLAGAAVTGTLALGKSGELDDIDSDGGDTTPNEYDAIQDDGRVLAYTTDGLLLGGAASVLTGGFLLLTSGDEETAFTPLNAPSTPGRTYSFEQ